MESFLGFSSGRRSRRRAFLNESVGHVAEGVEVLLAVGAGEEVGVGEALLDALGVAEEAWAEIVANEAGRGADCGYNSVLLTFHLADGRRGGRARGRLKKEKNKETISTIPFPRVSP